MSVKRQSYVLGFMFDTDATNVILIRKARPQWQAGRLNGVGGKIEPGETPRKAMVREFREETNIRTYPKLWEPFCLMSGPTNDQGQPWSVYCFRAFYEAKGWTGLYQVDEPVRWYNIRHNIHTMTDRMIMPNLRWLIPMGLEGVQANVFDPTKPTKP